MRVAALVVLAMLFLVFTLLRQARDPHKTELCSKPEKMPKQEKMALPRRLERQRFFRESVDSTQPTLKELLALDSQFNPALHTVTAILNHWSRTTICRQLDALRAQTAPPTHIWVCLFNSPRAEGIAEAVAAYNDSRVSLITGEHNFKYFGRFQLALAAKTAFVLVLDDDMIPGPRFLSVLLHVATAPAQRPSLLGAIGWLLPRPAVRPRGNGGADVRFASYRALANNSGGLYVPDGAYDLLVERLLEVDYLCSLWFGRTEWFGLLWREPPPTFATGEDFHLSHMLRKHAGVPSRVLPVLFDDRSVWGDTEHALAYGRYSTGGKATIALRDSLWWNALLGGDAPHWAAQRPLPERTLLALVDGPDHAAALAPLLRPLTASKELTALIVFSGGARGECAALAPAVGLPPKACADWQLRALDMRLGADVPDAPAAAAAAVKDVLGPAASAAASTAAAAAPPPPPPPPSPSSTAARLQAEALVDLGGMVRSLAPRLLLSLGDGSAPAARAAAQLSRLRELPHISLPLAEAAALPPFALAWVGRLPFDALLRWNAAPLTIAMLISRGAASAARALDALGAAVFFGDVVRLKLHVHADAPRDALALAQRWEWPPAARAGAAAAAAGAGSRKQVRYGIGRAEFDLKAAAAQTSLVGNAWLPTGDDEVVVVLDDGAELSPFFYAVLKHFLLTADRAHLLGVAFGLPEAPPPDAPHDAAADAAAKGGGGGPAALAAPCACATAYLAKPWLELHEFVADAASSAGDGGGGGGGGWSAHLAQFMGESGYRLHYPGAVLCRRADDPRAPPLAGASEVERVLSR